MDNKELHSHIDKSVPQEGAEQPAKENSWKRFRRFVKKSHKPIKYSIFIGLALLVIIPIGTYAYFVQDLSSKERIINRKNQGVILQDRNGEPFFTLYQARTKKTVPLSEIPTHTQQAFIAVEDREFYNHPGFSLRGIGRAIRTNLQEEEFAAGGSTISQQLIKNTLLSQNKSIFRKYQELVLAIELERRYSKEDILEMYLNTNYFGEGAFGIEEAAQRYFSKSANRLTVDESALLAAIIRAPSALSPLSGDREAAFKRGDLVIGLMRDQGFITSEEAEIALANEIIFTPQEDEENTLGVHFALAVRDKLIEEYGEQKVAQSGFVVKTTLDRSLQNTAQNAVATQVRRLRGNDVSNGAAVAIDPTSGEVLVLVGSYDWNDEQNGRINMALAPRQPGSSFKPLIYAAAIEKRLITPATKLDDKPVTFGSYKPRNYDNKFRGEVLVRYALANSLNIPAIHVMDRVGISEGVRYAQKFELSTLDTKKDYGLPLVLGAAEVPLIEMTGAFGVFANEGDYHEPILYTEIRDKNNRVIHTEKPRSKSVIPESVAYIISSILSDNKARQDTFGNSLTISRQAAVKTGTTEDYRDALTIGYTPQIVVGAWVGNNDNSPMDSIAGSLGAAPIWRQIMEGYLRGKPVVRFTKPASVMDELICAENGLIAEYATSSAYMEFFLRGTVPTGRCDLPPTGNPDGDDNNDEEDNDDNEEPTPTETPIPISTTVPTPTPTTGIMPSPTEFEITIPLL